MTKSFVSEKQPEVHPSFN